MPCRAGHPNSRPVLSPHAPLPAPPLQDFEGGHIKGAINVESSRFYDDEALDELIAGPCRQVDKVVVHCMMSQVRGPKSARLLAARLEDHEGAARRPTVLVLRGGFQRFAHMFKHDEELVADLNPALWSD